MSEDIYQYVKYLKTPDVKLNTIHSDIRPSYKLSKDEIITRMNSEQNIDYLAKMIIDRSDPLRNGASVGQVQIIKDKIVQYLKSWENLGKFDRLSAVIGNKKRSIETVNPISQIDSFNLEFLNSFSETILPSSNVTKVKSVVDPSGLYAQQERIIKVNSKPVPFYERALYKRLNDFNLDLGMDETEAPFYKMDHNPKLSEAERKKTNKTEEPNTHLDKQGMTFRMKPKYQKFQY